MTDRTSGRPRGFAFVTMSSPEEAQKAIEALNGAMLDGRSLTVNEAPVAVSRWAGLRIPFLGRGLKPLPRLASAYRPHLRAPFRRGSPVRAESTHSKR